MVKKLKEVIVDEKSLNWVRSLKEEIGGKQKKSSSEIEELETQADSETFFEDKLDRALADTFPASDPIPWISDARKTRY